MANTQIILLLSTKEIMVNLFLASLRFSVTKVVAHSNTNQNSSDYDKHNPPSIAA